MSEPPVSRKGEWQTPRLANRMQPLRGAKAQMPVDAEGQMLPSAALVHHNNTDQSPRDEMGAYLRCRPRSPSYNFPTPYLLKPEASSSTSPTQDFIRRPLLRNQDALRSFPLNQELEIRSLQSQVHEIQHRLNGDIVASAEYQQLINKNLELESALGATEHELQVKKYEFQELKKVFGTLESSAAQAEERMSMQMTNMMERHLALEEKYNKATHELMRMKEYLESLPLQAEHDKLKSCNTSLKEKISILYGKMHFFQHEVT
ncbi:hypothetical protein SK128_016581 [Halocaridina rubra]|uniref:Uncharacterized protein n=1 Tax=Halocaridina rubra TaxID=373956 RepID=A0AAN9A6E0_HALRR